jgi:SWI/SNF-related matrix-associated actin-dependent regulator 1 of chromatin subfamily A
MQLKEYQKMGVQKILEIYKTKNSALLADDMGLGKTAQGIAILKALQPKRVLIICPASLTYNWEKEIYAWSPQLKEKQLVSVTKKPVNRIDIVSYNIFTRNPEFLKANYDFLILDEAHYIKSVKSKRNKAVLKLLKKGMKSLMLTGTPMPSYTRDLFPLLNIALGNSEAMFKNIYPFYYKFCGAKKTRFGLDTTGSTNQEELQSHLHSFMVRRIKADVLPELPEKIISHIPIELDTVAGEKYAKESMRLIDFDKPVDLEKAKLAEHVMTARKRLGELKIKSALSFIYDLIDSGERLVIFGVHTEILHAIQEGILNHYGGSFVSYIDGSTNKRELEVQLFQDKTSIAFVGQIIAAGTGITLTSGTCCVFVETDWNPGNNIQAEDRIHRIGQKQSVNIYYLSARNSLDYAINNLLISKAETIKNIMEK